MEEQKPQENRQNSEQVRRPTRLEREAAALRDNLAKRKAQIRQREQDQSPKSQD